MNCNALAHATWSWLCWPWFCRKMLIKCCLNRKWLTMEAYKWFREVKCDLKKAICIVCNKTITLTMMGESALRAHGGK